MEGELSPLCALLEELIDDWGDPRLDEVRELVADLEARNAELEESPATGLRSVPDAPTPRPRGPNTGKRAIG